MIKTSKPGGDAVVVGESTQVLPPKEQSVFKRIVKCYEHKQYKNGLKFCRQILANPKYAEHGETLAMKGLILSSMAKKEEAYELVKRGLKNNLKSCICWHVFGLLQRADRKYDEAMKAYKCALRFENDNMQILRDLSLLQIQMRQLDGYRETRYQLLLLRPQQKASWIGYAMSFHLLGDYETTLKILTEFCRTQNTGHKFDYEHSELLLYHLSVLVEAGQLDEALTFLSDHDSELLDRDYVLETRATIATRQGHPEEAETYILQLVDSNPENRAYIKLLEKSRGLLDAHFEKRLELYDWVIDRHPRASLPRRLPLEFLPADSDHFRKRLDIFICKHLHKGAPQTFKLIENLYSDAAKAAVVEELVTGYRQCLEQSPPRFHSGGPVEPPCTLVWCLYLLAQHHCQMGRPQAALDMLDMALVHTPTLPELYALKGEVYRIAGDLDTGSRWQEEAAALDTADRFLNSAAARCLVQAGYLDNAEKLLGKFTREGIQAGDHLADMQCLWFLTECASSNYRCGRLGESLKRCHEVERHFSEMTEDQFDFHSYCLRKMTLRAYVDMLRLEDHLREHSYYMKAARTAISIYLHLHRHPDAAHPNDGRSEEEKTLSQAEMKKLKSKQRKAAKRKEQEAERVRQDEAKAASARRQAKQEDAEPEAPREEALIPAKLLSTDAPLDEAKNFLIVLLLLVSNNPETHWLAFAVYEARQRPLLMLRAVLRALELAPDHPRSHSCLVRFLAYRANSKNLPSSITELIDEKLSHVSLNGISAVEVNNKFYLTQKQRKSVESTFTCLRLKYELDPSSKDAGLTELVEFVEGNYSVLSYSERGFCEEMVRDLESGDAFGEVTEKWVSRLQDALHQAFPLASAFRPADVSPPDLSGLRINGAVSEAQTEAIQS